MRYISVVTASMFGTLIAFAAVFFFLLLFIFVMAAGSSSTPAIRSQSTLVVPLAGVIPETASGDPLAQSLMGESPYGLYEMTEAIRRAADDSRIDALWLKTGLTAMPWASMQAIRRSVVAFRESGKPVYASSSVYYMSEKEYFVASAADSVFLDPESLFELNGFVISSAHYRELLDRLHVTPQVVRAGSFKSAVEPFTERQMSAENRLQATALLDDISDVFIADVADSRGFDPDEFRSLFESEAILSVTDALEHRLIDDALYDDEIRAVLARRSQWEDANDLREVTLQTYARANRPKSSGSSDEIAVVYAVGTMTAGKSADVPNPLFGGATVGAESFIKALRRARDNRRTRAVVIRINSPGGQASAADAMLREIKLTAETMPVVVSMGDAAASGGYWIAVGAPSIVAEPLTITGSIGVFSLFFDVSGLLEDHLGITYDHVTTGPYADMLSGLRPYRPEEVRLLEAYTDETYQAFIDLVAEGRSLPPAEVAGLAEGRIWTGAAALERGLVDELGGLETAIMRAAGEADLGIEEYRIRSYPAPQTFWQRFGIQTRVVLTRLGILSLGPGWTSQFGQAVTALPELVAEHGRVQARMPFVFQIR